MPSINISLDGKIYYINFERHSSYPHPYYKFIINDNELIDILKGQNIFYIIEINANEIQLPPLTINNLTFYFLLANGLITWLNCKF